MNIYLSCKSTLSKALQILGTGSNFSSVKEMGLCSGMQTFPENCFKNILQGTYMTSFYDFCAAL